MTPSYHLVQSLIKALAILEILADSVEGMGVTEIGERVGMNKSTVHRILTTLVHEGYVEQDHAKGRYRLSFKLFIIARKIINNLTPTRICSPFLKKLAEQTGESARFIVPDWENARLIVVDEAHTSKNIKVRSYLGESLSLSKSAAGMTFLAHLSEDEIKSIMDDKGRKIVIEDEGYSFSKLRKDLSAVRESGFSYDQGQSGKDSICNVAAPVLDEEGKIVGVLDVFMPAFRSPKDIQAKYGKLVRDTALEVSQRLGYIPA